MSPGTLFSETTLKECPWMDTKAAVVLAENVVERHGAKPYGFKFLEYLESPPVTVDGEEMKVESKLLRETGVFYLGGTVRTLAQIMRDNKPDEDILRSNMLSNGMRAVITNCNSYRFTAEFHDTDRIVGADGSILK